MIRKGLIVVGLAALAICYTSPAMADDIHVCDINQLTSCNSGNAIQIGPLPGQAWVFGTPNTGDTLYFAVLTPQSGTSGNFSSGGNLWTALGFGTPPPQNFPNFASTLSQEQLATGLTPGSFTATSFKVPGNWTGTVNIGEAVTLPPGSVGTIYIAYLLDSSGKLVAVSPWSSSMIYVREPSSLVLVGVGLLALGVFALRRSLST